MSQPQGHQQPPVTEHERFKSLSPDAKRVYLAMRRTVSKYAEVSAEVVRYQRDHCKPAVEELIRASLLIRDRARGRWYVPRPEYGEELQRGFGVSAEEAKGMVLQLVGGRA